MRKENKIKIHAEESQSHSHYEPLVKFFELLLEWEMKEREEGIKPINNNEN